MKGWWSKGTFRSNPSPEKWRSSKFRKSIHIIVILMSRIFGRKDASHYPDKWIPIIHQVIRYGSILNWSEIISSNLDIQLKKVQKEHQFYISSYILDVICAIQKYPSLGWRWKPDLLSIHVYCNMLSYNKYKDDYEWICNDLFATIYRILFGAEAPCLSPKGQKIVKAYGDWYMTPDGVYIRISGTTKAPHWLPHFVPDTLLL